MRSIFKKTETNLYYNYHISVCFATKGRRRIFDKKGVIETFETELSRIANEYGFTVTNVTYGVDYVVIEADCDPVLSPAKFIHVIKRYTSDALKTYALNMNQHRGLWSWHGIVLVGNDEITKEDIREFLNMIPAFPTMRQPKDRV